jgi:hypothetical protein
MEQAVVVGNCQAKALEMMLSTNDAFAERFEFVSFPPVHEFPDASVPALHRAVADAAIVIPQRIEESYRDGMGLGTETIVRAAGGARVVRWPSVYWAGYFPDLFYARDAAGRPILDGPFDYHDRVIMQAYHDGVAAADVCGLIEDPEFPSNAERWAAESTAELDIRGKDCDAEVTSFIASQFREEMLFFTMCARLGCASVRIWDQARRHSAFAARATSPRKLWKRSIGTTRRIRTWSRSTSTPVCRRPNCLVTKKGGRDSQSGNVDGRSPPRRFAWGV